MERSGDHESKKATGVGSWALMIALPIALVFVAWLAFAPRDTNVRNAGSPPVNQEQSQSGNTGATGGVPTPPVTKENTPDPTAQRGQGGATSDGTRGKDGPTNPSEAVR